MSGEPSTVGNLLRAQAADRGEHPLLICETERISYAQADRLSARLSGGLVARGAGKGTHVGLLYPNGVAFVVGMLAAARIGAVVIPFSTFCTARELREQLVHSDTEILLTAASFRKHDYLSLIGEALPGCDVASDDPLFDVAAPLLRHVVADTTRLEHLADSVDASLLEALHDDVDGSDPLTIVYTSGTTSAPKGVLNTHVALLDHQRSLNAVRGLAATDTLFCNSPFFWIGGFGFALLATMVAGATLVCSTSGDPGRTLDLLEAEKPTITNGFTAGIVSVTRHPSFARRDLSSLRRGNLYPIMAPEVRPADAELRHNMLGLTEAGSVTTLSSDETDQPEHRRGSFGTPAPGVSVKLIDPDTGLAVGPGERGELCIRGACLMQRYHKHSREESFDPDGWLHTGDLAAADDEGFIYFLGRRGSMIKTAGANVSPSEVEKAIANVAGGATACVFGIPDPDRGQLVVAVVAGTDLDEAGLRTALAAQLSAYKVPRRIVVVGESGLPLLASGKADMRRMKGLFDG